MPHEPPAVVKLAERVLKELEEAVIRFPRYHKYAVGSELRADARSVARLATRAWRDRENRAEWISDLVFAVDDLKLSLQLGKELKAFRSFAEFEAIARSVNDLGRQCGGWQKHERPKGQNAETPASSQRAQILSARAASQGAHP